MTYATPEKAPLGPQKAEVPPEHRARIEELNQTIEKLEMTFPHHGARLRAAADLPPTAANPICKQECIQINKEYGELVRARVDRFMLSDKVQQLEQQYTGINPPFSPTNAKAVRAAMELFYPDRKGYSNLTQKFRNGDNEISRVRVRAIDDKIKQLSTMQGPTPPQQAFVVDLIATLESIKAMDPMANAELTERKRQEQPSKIGKAIKPQLQLAGMLIAAGMALLSLIAKKGRPSLPFAFYAGLAYLLYNGGLPKGKQANMNTQLAFLPDVQKKLKQITFLSEQWWVQLEERYHINGDAWANIVGSLMTQSGRKQLAQVRTVLLNKKATTEEKRQRIEALTQGFAPDEGDAAQRAFKNLATNHEDFITFSAIVLQVSDNEAKQNFLNYIRVPGIGPQRWKQLSAK